MAVTSLPLVIVDAANVVGSVPDGWWRDRPAATARLVDRLRGVASDGLDPLTSGVPAWATGHAVEVVAVVEGAARAVADDERVRIVRAPGSGDDAIVDLARQAEPDRNCLVVTADRQLRSRLRALGVPAVGPSAVPR